MNNRKEKKVEKDIKSNELLPGKNYGLVKLKEIIERPTGPIVPVEPAESVGPAGPTDVCRLQDYFAGDNTAITCLNIGNVGYVPFFKINGDLNCLSSNGTSCSVYNNFGTCDAGIRNDSLSKSISCGTSGFQGCHIAAGYFNNPYPTSYRCVCLTNPAFPGNLQCVPARLSSPSTIQCLGSGDNCNWTNSYDACDNLLTGYPDQEYPNPPTATITCLDVKSSTWAAQAYRVLTSFPRKNL